MLKKIIDIATIALFATITTGPYSPNEKSEIDFHKGKFQRHIDGQSVYGTGGFFYKPSKEIREIKENSKLNIPYDNKSILISKYK
jgi:hypothetical protein